MKVEFIEREYLRYYKGNGELFCQVDALHATPPRADLFTGKLVKSIIHKTGCAGIISNVSRKIADLNRKRNGENDKALEQYQATILEILHHLNLVEGKKTQLIKPFLHLTIHGMKDDHHGPYAIEIGTYHGLSCSPQIKKWLQKTLMEKITETMPRITVYFDQYFPGNETLVYHRIGDGAGYHGYGEHFHSFQLELSRTLREKHGKEMVELLAQILFAFQIEVVQKGR